jgi:hypothetical protein
MARTTRSIKQEYHDDTQVGKLMTQVQALCDELDALYAKLDADAGVTDVNYASTLAASTKIRYTTFDG